MAVPAAQPTRHRVLRHALLLAAAAAGLWLAGALSNSAAARADAGPAGNAVGGLVHRAGTVHPHRQSPSVARATGTGSAAGRANSAPPLRSALALSAVSSSASHAAAATGLRLPVPLLTAIPLPVVPLPPVSLPAMPLPPVPVPATLPRLPIPVQVEPPSRTGLPAVPGLPTEPGLSAVPGLPTVPGLSALPGGHAAAVGQPAVAPGAGRYLTARTGSTASEPVTGVIANQVRLPRAGGWAPPAPPRSPVPVPEPGLPISPSVGTGENGPSHQDDGGASALMPAGSPASPTWRGVQVTAELLRAPRNQATAPPVSPD